MTAQPFDDIRALIAGFPGPDAEARARTAEREGRLVKPAGALGRLEEISDWLAAWSGRAPPQVNRPIIAIFGGAHGVTARGVSAFPADVNRQMLETFAAGGAAINQMARFHGAGLEVFDLAVDRPTADMVERAAMSERECAATMAFGMEVLAKQPDLLILGEMGIGNTTAAAAVCHGLYGGEAADWTGRGTGVDDAGLARKTEAVAAAVARAKAEGASDPLQVLRQVGGRELAAVAGAIAAARTQKIPVILDGYVIGAAAAVLHAIDPSALDHCIAGHVSAEPGHRRLLERLGKRPLLDLGLRLGEGTGAAAALSLVRLACEVHGGMATFDQAGVSGKG
ncbi:nicotinate-nucleotide--dimethylbenzimidazole phosphoribosyltransferase [Caulobacter sp. CCUG 60055]|uniref:nicotinate-nucleotide--dimethylbenzimidazole phosphoribosyltransferase n=1 Tax=Caulobacter sp. CCUG 60055 TaxID=2100090 RepID=UPI001FA7C30C|nr:nicotinate-nucleotide--dimethylbenzimidazole phosphoribosyltransferase [Caulobacter sp. CCUG 60055]MBQ1541291.1 nicotinate-nucleotide--dimethylbenzimidazole phosphoribosyltransferase [Caulobacteraceae bacterium]MCI3182089.1 nicotinate-nucleotide--dimethylbenzimidazole phosphoribosyltransferase [Caulobacter sp. CCUG 60055]